MGIAIRAEHLSKEYRLGIINYGMLFRDIQSWAARKSGKPDPYEKIGAARYEDMPDRFWALKDISFDIEQGDRVGIIGRNGAGKSTVLKLISRITAPTEGCIKVKGRVVSLLEVGTGFHPELTGRENVYLNGAILGMKKRQVAKKMDEIIAFSEIEKFIDTPVKRYSSGMYVRLAFAVAAHLDSDILLADEVLAVGDASFQKKCLGKMEDVSRNQGRTVLFVSHNISMIRQLCLHGILLSKGSIVYKGDIESTIDEYSSAAISPDAIDLSSYKPKYYTEEIDVKSIQLVEGVDGEFKKPYLSNIELKLAITAITSAVNLTVSISFSTSDGNLLFSIHNPKDMLANIKEGTHILLKIQIKNQLKPGKYFIHIGILKAGHDVWWGENIACLEILDSPLANDILSGYFSIESGWGWATEQR